MARFWLKTRDFSNSDNDSLPSASGQTFKDFPGYIIHHWKAEKIVLYKIDINYILDTLSLLFQYVSLIFPPECGEPEADEPLEVFFDVLTLQ